MTILFEMFYLKQIFYLQTQIFQQAVLAVVSQLGFPIKNKMIKIEIVTQNIKYVTFWSIFGKFHSHPVIMIPNPEKLSFCSKYFT